MKEFFRYFALLFVLSIVMSNLSGCGGQAGDTAANAPGSGETDANANSTEPKRTSEYPPLASSLAQADIEMIDGSVIKVADRKGKVVLLNLWGIWCAPCRAEMPHLVKMQDEHRDKGFQIIGLNVGNEDLEPENIDAMKEFAAEMNLNYELARIPISTTEEFNRVTKFAGVPQTMLIDRDGNLRGVFLGGGKDVIASMVETVEKVVNE